MVYVVDRIRRYVRWLRLRSLSRIAFITVIEARRPGVLLHCKNSWVIKKQ